MGCRTRSRELAHGLQVGRGDGVVVAVVVVVVVVVVVIMVV